MKIKTDDGKGPMKISKIDIHKNDNPGFMFYQTQNEKTITEYIFYVSSTCCSRCLRNL